MSGTIGLGNIVGVAVAISIGGPGAMFWMIVMAFGMTLKFVEVSLVQIQLFIKIGTVSGGAIRYLSEGFSEKVSKIGKILAIVFAICCIGGSLRGKYVSSQLLFNKFLRQQEEDSFYMERLAWRCFFCFGSWFNNCWRYQIYR